MKQSDLNTILAVVLPIVFSSLVGFFVWKIQGRITAKAKALEAKALALAEEEREKRHALANEQNALLARITKLEYDSSADSQSLALLKQEMLPMAEAMKRKLVEILTHPSDEFKVPDKLLAQLNEVGAQMPPELEPLLEERQCSTNPKVTEREKLAAAALPIITKIAELEAKLHPATVTTKIHLVTSTVENVKTEEYSEEEQQKKKDT